MEEEDSNVVEGAHGFDNQREERKVVSDGANTGSGNLMPCVVTSVRAGWGARSIPPTADAALAVEDRVVRY